MAKTVDPSAKREADALLTVLRMAERHQQWPLMALLLTYIQEAGAAFGYLGPGSYAIDLQPPPLERNTQ